MVRTSILALLIVGLMASAAPGAEKKTEEGCQAVNPGQPKCSFTIASGSTSGVVTGAVGQGDWSVLVKRGKQKIKFGPSGTDPEAVSFAYEIGDKVSVNVKSTGGWVVAGHD
jgi:hypothetical protein